MNEFLKELADLLEKHRARLGYTNDDDGVHVGIGDEDVCIGWPGACSQESWDLNEIYALISE